MTPKEKALELVQDFGIIGMTKSQAKKCAIICVDETMKLYEQEYIRGINFWHDVKIEIKKL